MSYEEAVDSGIAWIEWRMTGEVELLMLSDVGGVVCGMTPGITYLMDEVAPRDRDGVLYRFWDRRPSDEQREAETWNV